MTTSTVNAVRWERRKDARASELLDAAIDLFVERGFSGTRLDDVAAKAGVSKGTLYLYYKNKVELLKAVVRAAYGGLLDDAQERRSNHTGSSQDLLVSELHLWWKNIGEGRLSGVPKLILSEACNFPEIGQFYYDEMVKPWWTHLQEVLKAGIKRGEFRSMDTEYAVRLLSAPLLHLTMWRHSVDLSCGVTTDCPRFIRAHIQTILFGLLSEHEIQRQPTGVDIGCSGAGDD